MVAVAVFLYFTYGTLVGTLILMIPVLLSQFATEAFMYLMHIDLNVNSLPVAAVGAGVGVDYGIYHFSRMIDLVDEGRDARRRRRLRDRDDRQGDHLHRQHDGRRRRSSGGSRT